jgi:hypothetical protein
MQKEARQNNITKVKYVNPMNVWTDDCNKEHTSSSNEIPWKKI